MDKRLFAADKSHGDRSYHLRGWYSPTFRFPWFQISRSNRPFRFTSMLFAIFILDNVGSLSLSLSFSFFFLRVCEPWSRVSLTSCVLEGCLLRYDGVLVSCFLLVDCGFLCVRRRFSIEIVQIRNGGIILSKGVSSFN